MLSAQEYIDKRHAALVPLMEALEHEAERWATCSSDGHLVWQVAMLIAGMWAQYDNDVRGPVWIGGTVARDLVEEVGAMTKSHLVKDAATKLSHALQEYRDPPLALRGDRSRPQIEHIMCELRTNEPAIPACTSALSPAVPDSPDGP